MAIVGRALRWEARDRARETPARIAERKARREAGEQAHAETRAKFAPFTEANAAEAIAWQAARIEELVREKGF